LKKVSPQNIAVHPHQIMACRLIILTLFYACALQMCWFPIVDDRPKQTYDNVDTQCSEEAHNQLSEFPYHFLTLQHLHSGCLCVWGPGEALHIDVIDLTVLGIKTDCEVLIFHLKRLTLQACTRSTLNS
jgi:hypothetical protein